MATVIPLGAPANEAEHRTILHLGDHLPESYLVLHNFEIDHNEQPLGINIAVIAPHAVYLVGAQDTRGPIDVQGSKWYPDGRQPHTSPVLRLRDHAESLKGAITGSQPGRRDLEGVYVDAVILLTAPDAVLQDPAQRDAPSVTTLEKSASFFQNTGRIPGGYSKDIGALTPMILNVLEGGKPRSGPLLFKNWKVAECLGGSAAATDYRAFNSVAGERSGHVRLRVYEADPYGLSSEEIAQQRRRIANAYEALSSMPGHPCIVGVRDFFSMDREDGFVLVTEDVAGQALRRHIDRADLALTLDQKLRLATDLLEALAHAHANDVVHRALTPSTVLVGRDGRPCLVDFDFARVGNDRSHTIAGEIVDSLEPLYTAPEVLAHPKAASPASDVFSAGVVLYELFTGEKPFESPTEAFEQDGVFPTPPSEHRGELPEGIDVWLQSFCAVQAAERPSAAEAAASLAALLAPPATMRADEFVEAVLSRGRQELRPLLDLLGNDEVDWLELKASLLPDPREPLPEDMNDADHFWHVARGVVALANSEGGALLLGVDDSGKPVDLSHSDPKGYMKQGGWDLFVRKVLDKALFRPSGWKTAKRGKWKLDVNCLKRSMALRQAKLDGRDIVAIVVRPAKTEKDLIFVDHTKDGETLGPMLFVRQRGDVGRVDGLEGETAIEGWFHSRQLASEVFANLLERLAAAPSEPDLGPEELATQRDWSDLPSGTQLTRSYVVEKKLGRGSFGVVYKVIDTLGDITRVVKLILRDRHSPLDRLKQEYRRLLHLPPHPNVVRVITADVLPHDNTPYIVFEYLDGSNVGEMIENDFLTADDVLELARQVAEGLAHIHRHGVRHCDIKPQNLLWTAEGVRILDFNVSVLAESDQAQAGGSWRYIPPDYDRESVPQPSDLADRDLYATGITLYEALTGGYPWQADRPPPGESAQDPRRLPGLSELAPDFVEVVQKAISPKRGDRFQSATELQKALAEVKGAKVAPRERASSSTWPVPLVEDGTPAEPNTNPYVEGLLTLFSQSRQSNVGTRGYNALARQTYVETALDRALAPAALRGDFCLVLITGNAGDGKTAFLERFERRARKNGAEFDPPLFNGSRFRVGRRLFQTNYDGSQDEGDRASDEVLMDFLAPFDGRDLRHWPAVEVRLIAINEGRLVDFFTSRRSAFPLLAKVVRRGLASGAPESGVAVINLNRRSVVVDPSGLDEEPANRADESIFAQQLSRMVHDRLWEPCHACDLKDRCYVFHNARTFQDPKSGPKIVERLKSIYTLTHLRGRLHVTLRDLRSALAFMLAGTRNCKEIHQLYDSGDREAIAQSFYFNSWMGGDAPTADRLLDLLKEIDVGEASDPRIDRGLGFVSPAAERNLLRFDGRGHCDVDVLRGLFDALPRDFSGQLSSQRARAHQRYLAMARRRAFFERRDNAWRQMLPYRSAGRMLSLIRDKYLAAEVMPSVLRAINRGEGLSAPDRLGDKLALQVRQVEGGSIRSYRVFPAHRFSLEVLDRARDARFVESMPSGLVLGYRGRAGNEAALVINLDVFEMLWRLNEGYRPNVEEEQGYYLSLAVFKNMLGSEPYQEVLLTRTGHDFYRVERHAQGRLEMTQLGMGVM